MPPVDEPESLEFPGCRPVRISRGAIADYEGRIEYWDAHTEVAMVCEPVSIYHEHPPQRLAGLLKTIAHVRSSPIETFGASDLLVRDAQGAHLRTMQADPEDVATAALVQAALECRDEADFLRRLPARR